MGRRMLPTTLMTKELQTQKQITNKQKQVSEPFVAKEIDTIIVKFKATLLR